MYSNCDHFFNWAAFVCALTLLWGVNAELGAEYMCALAISLFGLFGLGMWSKSRAKSYMSAHAKVFLLLATLSLVAVGSSIAFVQALGWLRAWWIVAVIGSIVVIVVSRYGMGIADRD